MMRNSENWELRNAGVNTAINTVPESRAAVMTSSHCSSEICKGSAQGIRISIYPELILRLTLMTHSIETGI